MPTVEQMKKLLPLPKRQKGLLEAIGKRLGEKEFGVPVLDQIINLLELPQQMLAATETTGRYGEPLEETYAQRLYKGRMPSEVYNLLPETGAGKLITDIVVDPLNLIGVGLITKGVKGVSKAAKLGKSAEFIKKSASALKKFKKRKVFVRTVSSGEVPIIFDATNTELGKVTKEIVHDTAYFRNMIDDAQGLKSYKADLGKMFDNAVEQASKKREGTFIRFQYGDNVSFIPNQKGALKRAKQDIFKQVDRFVKRAENHGRAESLINTMEIKGGRSSLYLDQLGEGEVSQLIGKEPKQLIRFFKTQLGLNDDGFSKIATDLVHTDDMNKMNRADKMFLADSMYHIYLEGQKKSGLMFSNPTFKIGNWIQKRGKYQLGAAERNFINMHNVFAKTEPTRFRGRSAIFEPMVKAKELFDKDVALFITKARDKLTEIAPQLTKESNAKIKAILNHSEVDMQLIKMAPPSEAEFRTAKVFKDLYDELFEVFDIPAHRRQYFPNIKNFDALDEVLEAKLATLSKKAPKKYHFFAKEQRVGELTEIIEDPFKVFELYVRKGFRQKHFDPVLKDVEKHLKYVGKLGDEGVAFREVAEIYVSRVLGLRSSFDTYTNNTIRRVVTNIPFLGKKLQGKLGNEQLYNHASFLTDLAYMSALPRPAMAIRNLFQSLNTAGEIGTRWLLHGLGDIAGTGKDILRRQKLTFKTDIWKEMTDAGIFKEFAPELERDIRLLVGESAYKKLWYKGKDYMPYIFEISDQWNRALAYAGSVKKWDYYFGKFGASEEFLKGIKLSGIREAERTKIMEFLNFGDIHAARREFAKYNVARTQYLYSKEAAPLITRHALGKATWQFQTWGVNYLSLLNQWRRDKQYRKLLEHLGAQATVMAWIGKWDEETDGGFDPQWIAPTGSIIRFKNGIEAFQSPQIGAILSFASMPSQMIENVIKGDNIDSKLWDTALEPLRRNWAIFVPFIGLAAKRPVEKLIKGEKIDIEKDIIRRAFLPVPRKRKRIKRY